MDTQIDQEITAKISYNRKAHRWWKVIAIILFAIWFSVVGSALDSNGSYNPYGNSLSYYQNSSGDIVSLLVTILSGFWFLRFVFRKFACHKIYGVKWSKQIDPILKEIARNN